MRKYLLFICVFVCFFTLCASVKAQDQHVSNGEATDLIDFPGTCTYNWVNNMPSIGLPASGTGKTIPSFTAVNTGNTAVTASITATAIQEGYAYIPNYNDGTITVINTLTNAVLTTIPAGVNPISVAINTDGSRIYVSNASSDNISVISTTTHAIIATIPVIGGFKSGLTISPDGSRLYVVNQGLNNVAVVNTATNAVIKIISVGLAPQCAVMNPDGSRVYVTNYMGNSISVISTANNSVIKTISVEPGPFGIAVSPDGGEIYVTNELHDEMSVINTGSNTVTGVIPVGSSPFGIAVSRDGSWVYVTNRLSDNVSVYNTASKSIETVITAGIGAAPYGVSVSADGSQVFVANLNSASVSVISTASNSVINTLPVGQQPYALGNFTYGGVGCSALPVEYTIKVDPTVLGTPTIVVSVVTGSITACAGMPSSSPNVQNFTVEGSQLNSDITVAAPTGFEVSLSAGSGYGTNLTLVRTLQTVNSTVIYVRSSASATGSISGNVKLTSAGALVNVPVNGVVNTLPTVNTVSDQTRTSGETTAEIRFSGTGNTFTWVNDRPDIGLPASGSGDIIPFVTTNTGTNPIKATITVTPKKTGFVYIANSNDNTVSVINRLTTAVTTIPVGTSPIGVSVNPDGKKVYVANYGSNNVSVINTSDNSIVKTINVGKNPHGIAVSNDGKRAYVTNSGDNKITIIDAVGDAALTTLNVGFNPIGVAISPNGSRVYVANHNSNSVSVINTLNNNSVIDIPVNKDPYGIVVSPDGNKVYVTSSTSEISVINTSDNTISNMPVGSGTLGITISPDGKRIYATDISIENSHVYTVNTLNNILVGDIHFGMGLRGISISPDGSQVYVSNYGAGSVDIINTALNIYAGVVLVGSGPESIGNFVTDGSGCEGAPTKFTITVNALPTPKITTTGTLAKLSSTYSNSSASSTNFKVSGTALSEGILIEPPVGFEVSTDDVNFSHTLTVGAAGTLVPQTIYVRLAPAISVGFYSGNIKLTSAGATPVNVPTVISEVKPALLVITANDVHKAFGVTLTGGAGSTAFTTSPLQNSEVIGSVTITYGDGAAAADPAQVYTGSVSVSDPVSGTFTASNYTIHYVDGNIIVEAATPNPVIVATGNLSQLITTYGTASASTSFTVSGTEMGGGILVNPPVAFEVSADNVNFSDNITVGAAGTIAATIVYVRLRSTIDAANYAGSNIALSSTGATNKTMVIPNSTVNKAQLTITAKDVSKVYGEELVSTTGFTDFITSGLKNSETVTSATINYGPGAMATDGVGEYIGSVQIAAPVGSGTFKASNYYVNQVNGNITVTKALLTITADNKSKISGTINPVLTVTYGGFVNNESAMQLTNQPVIITTANTESPVGEYPITISGAASPDYNFAYVPGVLSVHNILQTIEIPNTFTPNGDGSNDVWVIKNITTYPNNTVDIYNRYGEKLYSSIGYNIPWNGTYKGTNVPSGTYYYIVNPRNGLKLISGSVTIIR